MELKVIKTVPAEVHFNFEEMSNHLDGVLKQYTGIIITEDTVADGKKVVAELRKGQKSLDEFRKKTKKALTSSVTDFENQCKELSKKFDEVINPIAAQGDEFEKLRKEEKRTEVLKVIEEIEGLTGCETLTVKENYLNKSMSIKAIKEDLMKEVDAEIERYKLKESQKEVIKGHIEVIKAKYAVELQASPYITMLDYTTLETVIDKMTSDGKALEPITQSEIPAIQETDIDTEIFVDIYEVEGTEAQLNALEDFLNNNGYTWRIKE